MFYKIDSRRGFCAESPRRKFEWKFCEKADYEKTILICGCNHYSFSCCCCCCKGNKVSFAVASLALSPVVAAVSAAVVVVVKATRSHLLWLLSL